MELTSDAGIATDTGVKFLDRIEIEMEAVLARRVKRSGRVLCRPCLDWS
jgi:hypothetical protein